MKMAKASQADLEMALDVCNVLESLERGYLPDALTDPNDEIGERYDERMHAAKVVEHLLKIVSKGSMFRVCFGMTVVLDPRNEVVDPDADTLEIHPKVDRLSANNDALLTAMKHIKGAAMDITVERHTIAKAAEDVIVQVGG